MFARNISLVVAVAMVSLLLLAAVPSVAQAVSKEIKFTAHLHGDDEIPSNDSPGKGVGKFTYDLETKMLSYRIKFKGLSGPESAAHFHLPAAPGEVAPPVITIAGGGPPPSGPDAPSSLGSPYVGVVGPLTSAQEDALLDGLVYVNIHTALFPGGEIRGQVLSRKLGHTP